ncbi:MAG: asparagine synthase (glutamine-hydrolyzing) [Deltaproteobacteria bacterium]|nr:asparagine synthase (glutamine-hydrolyzing) [Deltaproteobacteria bacterium]
MCGITGIAYADPERPIDPRVLGAMNQTLVHRGPDDAGLWTAPGIGLAMRRLAVIDLAGGRQPAANEDGTIRVVCNGEIYNFRALADELCAHGHRIPGRGDTAVLPHAYEAWGEAFLDRLEGMFALAVWDGRERQLLLARDRLGKKPLVVAEWDGALLFGSELKALLAYPGLPREIDQGALLRYLTCEYISAPATIFRGVRKLEPGQAMVWRAGRTRTRAYWTLPAARREPSAPERAPGREDPADGVWPAIVAAVQKRLVADVPLGVFLSGGLDSSTIVAAARAAQPEAAIRTFSVAFAEPSFDESAHAAAVAAHFRTDHQVLRLSPAAALAVLPDLLKGSDEPFADPSIVPTYLLSRFARQHVTVALGGDGGDELFFGYPTFDAEWAMRRFARLPAWLRRPCGLLGARAPVGEGYLNRGLQCRKFFAGADAPMFLRHARWVGTSVDASALERLTGLRSNGALAEWAAPWDGNAAAPWEEQLQWFYLRYYLADDVLMKVDRAAMAVSLEVRAPLCDHGLLECLARLPLAAQWRVGRTKRLLKRIMRARLPAGICDRPKQGFAVPTAAWLRGPLCDWMRDLLAPTKLRREGLFDAAEVARWCAEHQAGRGIGHQLLWALCCFQEWLARWR